MATEINPHQIYEAYRKLKSYYYHDRTSLFIKQQIAEFEAEVCKRSRENFVEKFHRHADHLLDMLNGQENPEKAIEYYCNKIDCKLMPKKVKENEEKEAFTFFSNAENKDGIEIEQVNVMIDAPIEIHLISTLWVMSVGSKLATAVSADNYACLLDYKEDGSHELAHGLKLYKPYHYGYRQWRDKAHHMAKHLLNEQQDATIVSLDIQRFFYSARIDVQELCDKIAYSI